MIDCYCDHDPPTFYNSVLRRAKLAHHCDECGAPISPGQKYEYVSGLWDGSFSIWKTCAGCVDLRTWTKNNVPCLCWAHGSLIEDCGAAVEYAHYRAPSETVGLRFGFLRRREQLRQHNNAHRYGAS
jgi:hypothetical protein